MTDAPWCNNRSLGACLREGRLGLIVSLLCLSLGLSGVVQSQDETRPETDRPTVRVIEETDPGQPGETAPEPTETELGLVTNTFIDTDLRQALSDIAAQTGITIVPDDTVQGMVSCDFENTPFEDALRVVLMAGGYCYKKLNGAYLVGAPDPESPSFHWLADTEVIELNYTTSEDLEPLVPPHLSKFVTFDEIGNRLTIVAPEPILTSIREYLTSLDTPPLQLLIELLVVETKVSALNEFDLVGNSDHWGVDTALGTISYFSLGQSALATLKALVGRGLAKLRASPRIVAQEGREAMIEIGLEEYFSIVTGPVNFPYTTLEQVKAPIMLKVTPYVAADSKQITLDLSPEVSDVIGKGATGLPVVTVRRADLRLRVADGSVVAIGGLLQTQETFNKRKIPLLGDIPLIGQLFRSHERSVEETEVMIFVVPHVLDENGRFEGELLGVLSPPTEETSPMGGGLLEVPGGFKKRSRGNEEQQEQAEGDGRRAQLSDASRRSRVVSTRWLTRHLEDPAIRIVDLRESIEEYKTGHIPGAVHVGPDRLPLPQDGRPRKLVPPLVKLMGRLGATPQTTVVAYSHEADFRPPYLTWALEYTGHPKAAVLEGGVTKWQAEERPMTSECPEIKRTRYRRSWLVCKAVRATPQEVYDAIADRDGVVLEVCSPEPGAGEERGDGQGSSPRGVVRRCWQKDLKDNGAWKRDDELRKAYAELGVTPDKKVIVISPKGDESAHTYVTLKHVLGFKRVANYDGGFED